MPYWYVALGSAIGGMARFGLGTWLQERAGPGFPVGTLVVNVSGSLLIGFLFRYGLGTATSPEVRLLLTTGFCGGYTTFSTFSFETVRLLEDGEHGRAAVYVALSVALSLLGTWLGFALARGAIGLRVRG